MKKQKPISEEFVKRAVIQWLSANNWGKNLKFGGLRDPGVDIKVRHNKYPRYFFIETKGEGSEHSKSQRSQRETHFIYGLGQLITRMNVGKARYYYGLGLPDSIAKIALRRIPYKVALKLLIHIFSVNHNGKVKIYTPRDLKKLQQK